MSAMMESLQLSMLSSLTGESKVEDYIQPHYKEAYRLAIDHLVSSGRDRYQEFLKEERLGGFLSEEELLFITEHAERPTPVNDTEDIDGSPDTKSSTGTYWPMHSDVETPDLDLGWPEVMHERLQTNIDLLFHPPRLNQPSIKEVIRKNIQEAKKVIAIAMDIFTDVDIFKDMVDASIRGVPVYILLDGFHLKSFLTMADNQDVKIQKLRNMRVRTVKGQDYLCRSGAKFHGAMEQKFVVVDCHIVIYGSYSFMWSYEKINLSMVQVITGHLVKSYDEEFRTLYARSTVPDVLSPPEGWLQDNVANGRHALTKFTPHSGPNFERKDQLRHTLDAVYRKTCERQMGIRDPEERFHEEELNGNMLPIDYGLGMPQRTHLPMQLPETANILKRHSYAGERQDAPYVPQNMRYRASNWNVSGDALYSNGRNQYPMVVDNYLQAGPQMYRGHNMRQSYHGNDKQIVTMQQNMPTLENTSKSFLRTWRIESYLNNAEAPMGESSDYLDQYEMLDNKTSSYIPSRLRTSIVFTSTIPEQQESIGSTNNSTPSLHEFSAVQNTSPYYSPMQWNQTPVVENRMGNDDFMLKRRSLQILDDPRSNAGYNAGRNPHSPIYASLGRRKGGQMMKAADILPDSWSKRHSVADPRSNIEEQTYGGGYGRGRIGGAGAQNGGFSSNLSEEQRSVSHFDVKTIKDANSSPAATWQQPPSRTVSAAVLNNSSKEPATKSPGISSLKKSSRKIRSLLNIPEKKETSSRSQKLDSSTDTILAEDEEQNVDEERKLFRGTSSIQPQSEKKKNHIRADLGKTSSPRFSTEELHQSSTVTAAPPSTQQKHSDREKNERLAAGSWRKDRGADSRLYSRFEPFCDFDKKPSSQPAKGPSTVQSNEKPKSVLFPKSGLSSDHTHSHHDNKLGRFIQRVGHLIHKNK